MYTNKEILLNRAELYANRTGKELSTVSLLVTGTGKTLPNIKAGISDFLDRSFKRWMEKFDELEAILGTVSQNDKAGHSNQHRSLEQLSTGQSAENAQ
tara:strand:+ start:358 stop:651 length:294 start_codon:yes stop_codon:yes gene_type:complete